ncbi:MAG: hypothetical protein OXU77_13585 [Gammaproteobacteria bacterium]|nr:hypothetical protein [Gammaproteobacteria bacterium]MDE0442305.1 hypothetical protein [Gammaproteobacteria bacterium]
MTRETTFETKEFDASFNAALANCTELTRAEAAHFVEHGYVVIKAAFPREMADVVCESAWTELEAEYRIERTDPHTWKGVSMGRGRMQGYVRTQGSGARFPLKTHAPRAFAAQADVVGGADRLAESGDGLCWRDAVIGNFRVPNGPAWQPPAPRQPGWHKDGHHFRHFINSPEQGLLTVPIYTDILPRSGGTFIARDSIAPVARLLARCPAGVHPDGTQAGYLIPGLIEQCSDFAELTGEAGDVVLVHPYMLHRVSVNASVRPRFIANMPVVLAQPMCFDRPPDDAYSLVELAVLRALKVPRFEFKQTRAPLRVQPFPSRNEEEATKQRRLVRREMNEMAGRGIVTPPWGKDFGYLSKTEA